MPPLLGADSESGGRLLQPYGVLRLRCRILLALYERGLRFTLSKVRNVILKMIFERFKSHIS